MEDGNEMIIRVPSYNLETNLYDYHLNDDQYICEYHPFRINILKSGHIKLLFHKATLRDDNHNILF